MQQKALKCQKLSPEKPHKNKNTSRNNKLFKTYGLTQTKWMLKHSSLQASIEFLLLLGGLEATMSKLGGCVDELQLNLLKSNTRSLVEKGLTQSYNPLLSTNTASLDQQVILLHHTIMGKSTNRCNVFLSPVNKNENLRNYKLINEHQLMIGIWIKRHTTTSYMKGKERKSTNLSNSVRAVWDSCPTLPSL